ncbi:MAG TPA: Maf family protein [Anaerolineae bacterium]|nr:Maf family protein [Anaerolineae bacterium]HQK14666.1 Maf family protein [Anaerolineae bacterium]
MHIELLLASQSPRRREMIAWLGLPVSLVGVDIVEEPLKTESPLTMTTRLARAKAHAVAASAREAWILAADTVVDLDNLPLGKPRDPAEARAMLRRLRGRPHAVHTTVVLYHPQAQQELGRRVTTQVLMRPYTDAEIEAYVASRDPMDKAGAYAIQHTVFQPVARVERCYTNVVGLPLCAVAALLAAWNLALPVDIPSLCLTHFNYACPGPDIGESL